VSSRSVCGMRERRFRHASAGVCSLGLHLVWWPRSRRKVVGGRVASRLDELLGQIAAGQGWRIVAGEVMPEHVHLLVRVGPADAPASVVQSFKGRTRRVLRQEFPYLRNHAKVLWSPAYSSTSFRYVSETTVRRCTEHRWDGVGELCVRR